MNVDGKLNGLTVAWFTRVSWEPEMVLISVASTHYSRELLDKSKMFNVCIMGTKAKDTIIYFGSVSGRKENKFEKTKYSLTENNLPVIEGTIAYLECEKIKEVEVGDHILYIGLVKNEKVISDDKPLIYYKGSCKSI